MCIIVGRWISGLKKSSSSEFPEFLVASYFPHLELKKLRLTTWKYFSGHRHTHTHEKKNNESLISLFRRPGKGDLARQKLLRKKHLNPAKYQGEEKKKKKNNCGPLLPSSVKSKWGTQTLTFSKAVTRTLPTTEEVSGTPQLVIIRCLPRGKEATSLLCGVNRSHGCSSNELLLALN